VTDRDARAHIYAQVWVKGHRDMVGETVEQCFAAKSCGVTDVKAILALETTVAEIHAKKLMVHVRSQPTNWKGVWLQAGIAQTSADFLKTIA